MLNKELLLIGKGISLKPQVVMTVGEIKSEDAPSIGYAGSPTGSLNKLPQWKAQMGSGYVSIQYFMDEYRGTPKEYVGTELYFTDGFIGQRNFQITRVDTGEVFEFVLLEGRGGQTFTNALFHDLNVGDTVGLIFDPPPDGYQ